MNKQGLQEFKVNMCHNTLCQARLDYLIPLQQLIQCQYYHSSSDKRRNSNNYKPIFLSESNNELNDFCNNIIEYLYHPRIYGTLPCIFSKQDLNQHIQDLNIAPLKTVPFDMMRFKIRQNLFFSTNYLQNQIRSLRVSQRRMMYDLQSSQQLFYSKKYIQRTEFNKFEDSKNEFKQFKEVQLDLIIKYICAFLNSLGGTLYIGITDVGMIQGIKMNRKQIDDFQLDLDSCLRHFDPIILQKQVEIMFFPIYKDELLIIPDCFVIEIKVLIIDSKQLYFTHQNEAYIKRAASINLLKPKEIKDLVLLKLMS